MNREYPALEVLVWGDYACFTRPEMKVERVTYPVPTPTGARGILEAIYWKPEFIWQIDNIAVLKDIRYTSLLRNEVNSRASERAAMGWRKTDGGYIASADRAQRHTLALYDVAYLIRAHPVLKSYVNEDPAKFRDQFRRRVQNGRCFAMPYLGCREFTAAFGPPDGAEQPIDRTEDLGPMLLDIVYAADGSGRGEPRFFQARLERGVLHVPSSPERSG